MDDDSMGHGNTSGQDGGCRNELQAGRHQSCEVVSNCEGHARLQRSA